VIGFGLYKVTGDSMLPNYCPGDYVLTWRPARRSLKSGDVVVVDHPRFGNIIKRIQQVLDPVTFTISGDNTTASTDSTDLGPVSIEQVRGKVVWRIAR
jgi:nickel-type superoxide dismutase maturation protease